MTANGEAPASSAQPARLDVAHRAAAEALAAADDFLHSRGLGAEEVVVLVTASNGLAATAMSTKTDRTVDASDLLAALLGHARSVADVAGLRLDLAHHSPGSRRRR